MKKEENALEDSPMLLDFIVLVVFECKICASNNVSIFIPMQRAICLPRTRLPSRPNLAEAMKRRCDCLKMTYLDYTRNKTRMVPEW